MAAFLLCSILAFRGPNDKNQKSTLRREWASIDTSIKDSKDQYAYIISITKENGIAYATVDYIQLLVGKEAFEAAKKHHDLDTAMDENGHIEVSVDNDIYIVNDNKKLRKIPLASKVEVVRTSFRTGNLSYVKSTLAVLAKDIPPSPFNLVIRNGKISEIHEVYIP